jgi:hypothetical protein
VTVTEAIDRVREAGSIGVENGNLRTQFPESKRASLRPALDCIRAHRDEALRLLTESSAATAHSSEVAEPTEDELGRASRLLSESGVRLTELDGVFTIGIWSDLDSPTLRAAIRMFHPEGMPRIAYLDGPSVPTQFKLRIVPGDPVPTFVLAAMEKNPEEPWRIRVRMLSGLRTIPYAAWKAEQINRVFAEQGTGGSGWITPATVQDGLLKEANRAPSRRKEGMEPKHAPDSAAALPRRQD